MINKKHMLSAKYESNLSKLLAKVAKVDVVVGKRAAENLKKDIQERADKLKIRDTGNYIDRSFSVTKGDDGYIVSSSAEYAWWQEFGQPSNPNYPVRPHWRPAISEAGESYAKAWAGEWNKQFSGPGE